MDHMFPGSPFLLPLLFHTKEDQDQFLDSLDSDTREYVINNAGDYKSLADLENSLAQLHGMK